MKKRNIQFVTIKPRKSFFELYKKYGFPSRNYRWCNKEYKLDALRQLQEFLKNRGFYLVSYIGFCADETKRFKSDPNERKPGQKIIYPLAEKGIIENDIWEWAKETSIFNNYYKYNKRCGCMFCPMHTMMETAYLKFFYPEKYNEMKYLIKQTELKVLKKTGKPYSVFCGTPKYNMDYRDKQIEKKYLPKIKDLLK